MTRIGIIGAGRMGKCHTDILSKIDGVTIAAVYDPLPAAAQFMSETYGAKICGSAAELASSGIDGVLVCSPTPCHHEGALAALEAKLPVFCEKPLCRNRADAEHLVETANRAGVPFAVGFVRRHAAKTKKFKELFDSGILGKLHFCNVDLPLGCYARQPGDWFTDFEKCGGTILDMLAHHVDLANWLFGDARRVYAQSDLLNPGQSEPADYTAAIVTYRNGLICNMMSSWQRFGRTDERMEIYGENGCLTMDGSDHLTMTIKGSPTETIPVDNKSGHAAQMADFIAAIREKRRTAVSIDDGWKSLAIGLAMIESARENRVVEL